MVDILHLLDVGEQVPVVDSEVGSQLLSTVLVGEWNYWFLILVWEGRLQGGGCAHVNVCVCCIVSCNIPAFFPSVLLALYRAAHSR